MKKKVELHKTLGYYVSYNSAFGDVFTMGGKMYRYVQKLYDYSSKNDQICLIVCKTIEEKSKYVTINVTENRDKEITRIS